MQQVYPTENDNALNRDKLLAVETLQITINIRTKHLFTRKQKIKTNP